MNISPETEVKFGITISGHFLHFSVKTFFLNSNYSMVILCHMYIATFLKSKSLICLPIGGHSVKAEGFRYLYMTKVSRAGSGMNTSGSGPSHLRYTSRLHMPTLLCLHSIKKDTFFEKQTDSRYFPIFLT
jgi:hypothetical protein